MMGIPDDMKSHICSSWLAIFSSTEALLLSGDSALARMINIDLASADISLTLTAWQHICADQQQQPGHGLSYSAWDWPAHLMRLLRPAVNSPWESPHTFNTHKQKTQHKHESSSLHVWEGQTFMPRLINPSVTVHKALHLSVQKPLQHLLLQTSLQLVCC